MTCHHGRQADAMARAASAAAPPPRTTVANRKIATESSSKINSVSSEIEINAVRPRGKRLSLAADGKHLLLAAGERSAALMQPLLQARKKLQDAGEVGVEIARSGNHRSHLQVLEHAHAQKYAAPLGRLGDFELRDPVRGQPRDV